MGYYKPLRRDIPRGQRYGANPGWGPNPAGGHNGDDYLSQVGEPVYAAGHGEVIHVGPFDSTYADNFGWNLNFGGNMVVLNLDGEEGPYVEYGHLEQIHVKAGDRVVPGQVIATTGETDGGTGVITGPHLHVGVLPPSFDLNTNTYGRVDPDLYLTDYWSEEDIFMALTDKEQARILAAADRINGVIPDPKAQVLTTAHVADIVTQTAQAILNTPIRRGGAGAGIGDGKTSLGAMVAWNDDHTIQTLGAVAATTAASGGSVEDIKAAVVDALKENVVQVDVSVSGAGK